MNKQDILKIIAELSGCDASDDYAKGWDDACKAIENAVMEAEKVN